MDSLPASSVLFPSIRLPNTTMTDGAVMAFEGPLKIQVPHLKALQAEFVCGGLWSPHQM
jgi:hypothetical protein